MKRPTGVTLIGLLMAAVAVILALGCVAFFFVFVLTITGEGSSDPASAAITGMAMGAGFSLIVPAGLAAGLAVALFKLREWAWSASIVTIGLGAALTMAGIVAFRRFFLMPVGLSLVCHLAVVALAGWMLTYLLRPGVKQAFNATGA